ncbi:hypothetical protein HID58_076800, partial [Brassica napus]
MFDCQTKIIDLYILYVLVTHSSSASTNNLQVEPKATKGSTVDKWPQPKIFEAVARGSQTLPDNKHLNWILANVESENSAIKLHLETVVCYLAPLQNHSNPKL